MRGESIFIRIWDKINVTKISLVVLTALCAYGMYVDSKRKPYSVTIIIKQQLKP